MLGNSTQAWLGENLKVLPKNTWSSSSPAILVITAYGEFVMGEGVSKYPPNTRASLRLRSLRSFPVDRTMVANACRRFRSRIERAVEAEDEFTECRWMKTGIIRTAIAGLQNPDYISFWWISPGFEINSKKEDSIADWVSYWFRFLQSSPDCNSLLAQYTYI